MDLFESLEIYIPVEAEVKSIALKSLPNSVVRRMSLPLFDTDGSKMDTDSQEGIWICPAVLRKKGQKSAAHAGNGAMENMSSLMDKEFRSARNPLRISFVSSNRAAYRVLKDTLPGNKVSAHASHSSLLPTGSAPRTYQDAVIIYRGCIYLSIRKPRGSRNQQKKCEPQPSNVSSKSQKHQAPQASLEPADKELQAKRLHVALPQISLNKSKNLRTKTDQELLNNSPKKKRTTCKVPHSKKGKDATCKGGDVSSSKTARSVPQSTDSVHNLLSHCSKDTGEEQAAEEAASPEPAWFQPPDGEMQHLGNEEAESTNPNKDMDSNVTIDSGEPDNIVGVVEQSSNQSWTRRESEGAACASTSLQQEVDFKELAHEEMIARVKAKLRLKEAILNNLPPS